MCDVESHPFDLDTMLFMDWRDDHTAGDADMRESNEVHQLQPTVSEPLLLCHYNLVHMFKALECRCTHPQGRLRT
jgi:hypothetical protein